MTLRSMTLRSMYRAVANARPNVASNSSSNAAPRALSVLFAVGAAGAVACTAPEPAEPSADETTQAAPEADPEAPTEAAPESSPTAATPPTNIPPDHVRNPEGIAAGPRPTQQPPAGPPNYASRDWTPYAQPLSPAQTDQVGRLVGNWELDHTLTRDRNTSFDPEMLPENLEVSLGFTDRTDGGYGVFSLRSGIPGVPPRESEDTWALYSAPTEDGSFFIRTHNAENSSFMKAEVEFDAAGNMCLKDDDAPDTMAWACFTAVPAAE